MTTGYTRADIANNISDGNIINAADLDAEFDALQTAFNAVNGHSHDGTLGEGAPILVVGPTQDVVVTASTIQPKVDNTVDLGTNTLEFKDLWIDGTANIDSLVADTADINAGTIDGVVIGGTAPAAGTFTTLATTSSTVGGVPVVTTTGTQTLTNKTISVDNNTVSGIATSSFVLSNASGHIDGSAAQKAIPSGVVVGTTDTQTLTNKTLTSPTISGGTINSATIGGTTAAAGTFTSITASSATIGGAPAVTTTATQTLTNKTLTSPAINTPIISAATLTGSSIDSSPIGVNTPAAGNFTTLTAGGIPVVTTTGSQVLTGKTINLGANTLVATSAQIAAAVTDETGTGSLVFSVSPALTGNPTATTQPVGNNSTRIATTAFVQAALSGSGLGDMLKAVYDTNNDGVVDSADKWQTARTVTIGATGKAVDGTSNVSWNLSEIGVNNSTLTLATSGIATGSQTWTANQGTNATFTVNVPGTDLTMIAGTTAGPTIVSSTGSNVVIRSASLTESGVVTTGAQSFAGTKTFATIEATNITFGGTPLTATAAEINHLSGVTSAVQTQLNGKQPLNAALTSIAGLTTQNDRMIYTTAANTYAVTTLTASGRTFLAANSTAAQIAALGITATAAEINKLAGATPTTTEINYLTGVTSAIQTQLNGKQPLDSDLTAIANLGTTGIIVRSGAGTAVTRAIAAGTGLTVVNGTGVSGNPTLSADVASQVEAEAGTSSTKLMTPERTKQAIDTQVPALITTSAVLSATAGATAGDVGTYALLGVASVANSNYGDTRAGSDLYPAGFRSTTAFTTSTGAVSSAGQNSVRAGTWRCMGVLASAAGTPPDDPTRYGATLWLRIS